MDPGELVATALVLVGTVAFGMLAHELAHALTLQLLGVPFEIQWLPAGPGDGTRARLSGTLAAVVPRRVEAATANRLRVAAMTPLLLATPLALVPLGMIPDPFVADSLVMQVAVVGWLACAIPSPDDFSLVWYADRAIAGLADSD